MLATGFKTTQFLAAIDVTGAGGTKLADAWSDGAHAYLGITTAGFPNLFMLYGPNTNNGSIIYMIEAQVEYAVRHLQWMDEQGASRIDVKPEVEAEYNRQLDVDMATVGPWAAGNCHNYYRSASGRIVTQWPHSMSEYRRRTETRRLRRLHHRLSRCERSRSRVSLDALRPPSERLRDQGQGR